jgi:levansucrase
MDGPPISRIRSIPAALLLAAGLAVSAVLATGTSRAQDDTSSDSAAPTTSAPATTVPGGDPPSRPTGDEQPADDPPSRPTGDEQPEAGRTDMRTAVVDRNQISLWNQQDMQDLRLTVDTELPVFLPPVDVFDPTVFQWDAWPVRTWDGGVAEIDGHTVLIGLSAPRTPEQGPVFYSVSEWRYWYTDGDEWVPGGLIFDEPLGSRQWAGSTRYDPETGRISFYYTAVGDLPGGEPSTGQSFPHPSRLPQGDPAEGRPPVTQQIALVEADVVVDDEGLRFENFDEHRVILEAGGPWYQTYDEAITDAVIYGFRDPWAFEDPASGDRFVLFTGNAAFNPGPQNGVVGVGALTDEGWELRPPIVAAPGVNSQLERPHLVWRDGDAYLFWTTHSFVFSEEGSGPEGLYGMFADSGDWRGPYVPLNDGGLVLGNPPIAPVQTYSYLVLPTGHVMSYLNQAGRPGADGEIGTWVGGPAPLVRIEMDGGRTRLVEAVTPVGLGRSDGEPSVPTGEPEPEPPGADDDQPGTDQSGTTTTIASG